MLQRGEGEGRGVLPLTLYCDEAVACLLLRLRHGSKVPLVLGVSCAPTIQLPMNNECSLELWSADGFRGVVAV